MNKQKEFINKGFDFGYDLGVGIGLFICGFIGVIAVIFNLWYLPLAFFIASFFYLWIGFNKKVSLRKELKEEEKHEYKKIKKY